MRTVRAFGKSKDPSDYRHGFGFTGWWLNVINKIRVLLERHTVFLILRLEAEAAGYSKEEVRDVIRETKRDPSVRPWLSFEEQDLISAPKPLQRVSSHGYNNHEEKVQARYGDGRKNQDYKPTPIDEGALVISFSAFQRHRDRRARYVQGRQTLVYDDHFVSLGKDSEDVDQRLVEEGKD